MTIPLRGRPMPLLVAAVLLVSTTYALPSSSWMGTLRDQSGKPVQQGEIQLRSASGTEQYTVSTSSDGKFVFASITAGTYHLSVGVKDQSYGSAATVVIGDATSLTADLVLSVPLKQVRLVASDATAPQASGGEHLSSSEVSSLPLNSRDFSKLLLLAAGTMTDANGAANFTQQFAVNGQRGTATVFAMDGADTTDPEMGGATFSNFNVDAIQEVQSNTGVIPAEIGHGAASYTNVVTKSGTNQIHGSVFEFARNAAFDARNYFDHNPPGSRRRIPPFVRNEFGFTNGGPLVIPGIYNGRNRTFYFGEYQGFRQVLGTTQVFPVPTAAERQGIVVESYPNDPVPTDTLTVPVDPAVLPIVNGYPLPNAPQGPYGARTYAASSKVSTRTDQFSVRMDHHISDRASLLTRFSLNQVTGPVTNPDQTAINPTFGVQFFDHQRNAAVKYTRTLTPHLTAETSVGYIRSTPFFPAANHTVPGIGFGDGLFQGYNSAAGQILGSYSNLYQFRHDMSAIHRAHAFKWGVEIRVNRDSTIFGTNPNGSYTFGGGTAYAPYAISSASGTHNIPQGGALPDSLVGLLTASPYSYSVVAAAVFTPVGGKFDEAGVRREAYNFYFQDAWKATPQLTLNYGLRYEVNSRIHEATKRTSLPQFFSADGKPARYWDRSAKQMFVIDPQPPYTQDWNGWGPRIGLDYALSTHTVLHTGAAVTTLIPNLWQDNFLTASIPFVFSPTITASTNVRVPFQSTAVPLPLPTPYDVSGNLIYPTGRSTDARPNTILDLERYQADVSALTPGHEVQLPSTAGIARNFRNGYIASYTLGVDRDIHDFKFTAAYVATVGVHLASVYSPNSYAGAEPAFAPYTRFDSTGKATGGYGIESLITSGSHSSYHSLQTGVSKNSARLGLGMQASYTYSKSLDDTSAVLGGLFGTAGVILQTLPQDPWNPRAEKGPSTFDVTHVVAVSVIQLLPLERVGFLRPLGRTVTSGWQFLNISTLMTGPPFTVFSGVQQTGVGAGGTDRPDLVSTPNFSASRSVREDYFGRGDDNKSFFSIPINVPGGTGPNHGRFGTLGRDTFRGPGFHQFDVALIKDTPFGHRASAEFGTVEFRAEFFNVLNLVNFGLPSNIVRGTGFGKISKTAGSSRQIQFSLKLIY
jgi:hypothetical protein